MSQLLVVAFAAVVSACVLLPSERDVPNDPYANRPIFEDSDADRLEFAARIPQIPTNAKVAEGDVEEIPVEARTSDIDFAHYRVLSHVQQTLRAGTGGKIPFGRWEPWHFENPVIEYVTYGLDSEANAVFDAVMADFIDRTGLPIQRGDNPNAARMTFAYIQSAAHAAQIPILGEKLQPLIEQNEATSLEFPLEPPPTAMRIERTAGTDGEEIFAHTYFARPLRFTDTGNVLAGLFVKDIYNMLVGGGRVTWVRGSPIGTPMDGEPYSWRVPLIDAMFIRALYRPNVPASLTIPQAVARIVQNMAEDAGTGRSIRLHSRFDVSGGS